MKKRVNRGKLFIILIMAIAFIGTCMYSGISGGIEMKIYYKEYPVNALFS